jgi:hypothetical protein
MTTIYRQRDLNIGPQYLHIDNSDLRQSFNSAALIAGADINTVKLTTNGEHAERILMSVDLPRLSLNVPELGGQLTPRLWLRNDNTGRAALTVGIGFFRWVCMNGLYIGVNMFGTRLVHRDTVRANSVLDQLPGAMVAAMESIADGSATDIMLDAAESKVYSPIDVIGSLDIGTKAKQRAIDIILLGANRAEDSPNTVWGLYNIVNEACRSKGRSLYRSAVKDMSLLEDIQFLSENEIKIAI